MLLNWLQRRYSSTTRTKNSWWNNKVAEGKVLLWVDNLGYPCFLITLDSTKDQDCAKSCIRNFHSTVVTKWGMLWTHSQLDQYKFERHNRPYVGTFIENALYLVVAARSACDLVAPRSNNYIQPRVYNTLILFNFFSIDNSKSICIKCCSTWGRYDPKRHEKKLTPWLVLSMKRKMVQDQSRGLLGPEITFLHQPVKYTSLWNLFLSSRTPANTMTEVYFHTDYTPPSIPPNSFAIPLKVFFGNIPAPSAPEFCNGLKFFVSFFGYPTDRPNRSAKHHLFRLVNMKSL